MAKAKLLGNDRKEKLEQQKKAAKKANKKKRKSPAKFFKDIISELKKVTWPTAKDLIKYAGDDPISPDRQSVFHNSFPLT